MFFREFVGTGTDPISNCQLHWGPQLSADIKGSANTWLDAKVHAMLEISIILKVGTRSKASRHPEGSGQGSSDPEGCRRDRNR